MADPVAQYLARHARAEAAIADAVDGRWDHVVVLPAFAEPASLFAGLAALAGHGALVILVINEPAGADPVDTAANRELFDAARDLGRSRRCASELPAYRIAAPDFELLVVDRASPGNQLPPGQGVGLARRVGMDLALALRAAGKIASRWLHTTDADVTLPADYLEAAGGLDDAVALTYPYWHVDGELRGNRAAALGLYELSLRYHVLGTRWAGVPSFSAIGSTLAVDARSYAEVRGVPLRQAGEDFYLLSKLEGLGAIRRPRSAPIEIRGRDRARAPFGTAPAIARIAARLDAGGLFELYAPASFAALAEVRRGLDRLGDGGELELGGPARAAFDAVGGQRLIEQLAAIDPRGHLETRRRQARQWLDALKALRLVHELRDRGQADVYWREALIEAPFAPDPEGGLTEIRCQLSDAEDAILG